MKKHTGNGFCLIHKVLAVALVLTLTAAGSGWGQTNIGGIISENETWSATSSPYRATATVIIPPGVTLTIQDGVRVNFAQPDCAFEVYGTLMATNAILTTEVEPQVPPNPVDHWAGVIFWPGSTGVLNGSSVMNGGTGIGHHVKEIVRNNGQWQIIDHYDAADPSTWVDANANVVVLSDNVSLNGGSVSGSYNDGIWCKGSKPAFTNVSFSSNRRCGISCTESTANPVITSCAITMSDHAIEISQHASVTVRNGTLLDNNRIGIVVGEASSLSIDGCTVSNSTERSGIELWDGSTASVTNCVFTNNALYPIQLYTNQEGGLSGAITALSGNSFGPQDLIGIGGTMPLLENYLWNAGIPYKAIDDITVVQGVSLIVADGVTIKFPDVGYGISVLGSMSATNATFTALTPLPGEQNWQAIFFWPGSSGLLENCRVEYGGSIARQFHPDHQGDDSDPSYYLDALGNVVISGNASVALNNVTSKHSFTSGIYVSNGSPSMQTVTATENRQYGLRAVSSSAPNVQNCQFDVNGEFGVHVESSSPTFTSCTFSNNTTGGMWSQNSRPSFTGGRFENNGVYGLWLDGPSLPSLNGIQVIAGNDDRGVVNTSTTVVSAKKIYWGDPSGPHDEVNADGLGLTNPDGLGDNVSEYVDWNPYRSSILAIDAAMSEIFAVPREIPADGQSRTMIKVTPRAPNGDLVGQGLVVTIFTTKGTLVGNKVADNHDGTYSQELKAPTTTGTAMVTAVVEGVQLTHSATVSFAVATDPPAIDLATQADVRIEVTEGGSQPAFAVAMGDFDGDSYDDMIVSDYQAKVGNKRYAGKVYVLYGPMLSPATSYLPRDAGTTILGEAMDDYLGLSLACGYVDDDHFCDLVVGAPGPNNTSFDGKAYVIFGGASRPSTLDLSSNSLPLKVTKIVGAGPGANLGCSVAAGDINGDGFADVLIGAPYADPVGRTDAGKVFVLNGAGLTAGLVDLSTTPALLATIVGEAANDHIGSTRSLNTGMYTAGDPFEEVFVTSRDAASPSGRFGAAYVVEGSSALPSTIDLASASILGKIQGAYEHNSLRNPISVVTGDIDGDSYTDLIFGAPTNTSLGRSLAGTAYVYYGNGGAIGSVDLSSNLPNLTKIYGANKSDNLGNSSATGDFDNDGKKDVIVLADGANNNAGVGYAFAGGSRLSGNIDLADPFAPIALVIKGMSKDGVAVSAATGNVNGDNVVDLLIGAPNTVNSTSEAYVVLGGSRFRDVLPKRSSDSQAATEEHARVPTAFALKQNYPNPFNPSTNINYQIPNANHVVLKVLDILGREVATLVNEVKEPGPYTATWDASGVASGVYMYRLKSGQAVQTRRCLLLK